MVSLPPTDLPVEGIVTRLRDALSTRSAAVLVAPPGAGKTTLVPLRLLDEPWLDGRTIMMLEPRRLAARAAARRLSALMNDEPGGLVGYQTRDERRIGKNTRIQVVTEGILTRRLQSDPELPGVGLVIFDEVHERNLPTDLGLALVLDTQRTLRPDLKLLAMSATADADKFARLLGPDTPIVTSEGRQFPVDIRWAAPGKQQRLDDAVSQTVQRALRECDGDVLVFLPGIGEITRVQQMLESNLAQTADNIDVYPLAGALSLADQDRALAPSPAGRRRVVLSTDIAETSLTVDGVSVVVDAGEARVPRYDPRTGMTRLTTIPTSRASADQRAGRAGRLGPGVAYRCWSKLEHGTRRAQLAAEITQVDLCGFVLETLAWGTALDELSFIDAPPSATLQQARELLAMLGALDHDGRLTDAGRRLIDIPVHPRLAHMIAESSGDDRALACAIAALLDDRDVMRGRPDDVPIDIALRLQVARGDTNDDRADRRAVARWRDRADDLARRTNTALVWSNIEPDRAGAVLLLAYPDRLAVRRQPGQFQMRNGSAAWCRPTDTMATEPFVVTADLDGDRKNARIRLAAAVEEATIERVLASDVITESVITFDKERRDIVERVTRRLDRMRLADESHRPAPGDKAIAALVEHVVNTRLSALPWSTSTQELRSRVAFLHREVGEPWPDWSDKALVSKVADWLAPYLAGMTSVSELASLDLAMLLRSQLPWPEGARLDDLAPAHIELASGRRIRIDYTSGVAEGTAPVVPVRVQDLFGTKEHPSIGGGRVNLVLQLLSPADRPIQITSDLPGFWAGSWSEVRKEMAGRYPKHNWPVDPANADPKRMKDR
ncbi:MAG: ATP-dependent helicase HrpB [Acidimicrobiales bacterium mtb01]|nr:ATP-dependent helicase HrpB [Actinomycetota bacterium]TEX47333.1 MAG: ATP-dependent helicase HrpB [Acidimicrobiales bacterium mtb01]